MGVGAAVVALNIAGVLSGGMSSQSIWSLVNQLQLYMTILLLQVYVPDKLVHYWTGFSFSTFSFSFLTDLGLPKPTEWYGDALNFDTEQLNYDQIGVESGSLFVNESYFVIMFFVIFSVDL